MAMTLSEGYRHVHNAKPHLDYPYLSLPDIDEDDLLEESGTLTEKELYL